MILAKFDDKYFPYEIDDDLIKILKPNWEIQDYGKSILIIMIKHQIIHQKNLYKNQAKEIQVKRTK